jgi:reactive intermediate/imine deaminase
MASKRSPVRTLMLRELAKGPRTTKQLACVVGASIRHINIYLKEQGAVRVGDVIFLAGQIGTDAAANGAVIAGGIEAETRQTLENIKRTVEAVGSSMDNIVKCTVMMADMAEWDRMNVVYREFFSEGRLPARSAFGTSGLALNARVEIECIATR